MDPTEQVDRHLQPSFNFSTTGLPTMTTPQVTHQSKKITVDAVEYAELKDQLSMLMALFRRVMPEDADLSSQGSDAPDNAAPAPVPAPPLR